MMNQKQVKTTLVNFEQRFSASFNMSARNMYLAHFELT